MHKYMGQGFAEKLGELAGLDREDQEVVAYGLEYLLSSIIGAALILLAGFALGIFLETLAVFLCWGLLRLFAGGSHCTARWRCAVTSGVGMLIIVLAAKGAASLLLPTFWVVLCTACTLAAMWLWAPNNPQKPVRDPQRRKRLRQRALTLAPVIGIFLFYLASIGTGQVQAVAVAGATGLVAGAFMLSPAGFRLMAWCDNNLEIMQQYFSKGGENP